MVLTLKTKLHDHQVEAVDHLLEHPLAALNHPMGSGKTLTALAAAVEVLNNSEEHVVILILTNKGVCTTWLEQISLHIAGAPAYLAIDKKTALKVSRTAKFVIASYHSCAHLPLDLPCAVLIADECQTFRNTGTLLFGRVKVWASTVAWFWGLSGTHVVNKAADAKALKAARGPEHRDEVAFHHLSAQVKQALLAKLPPLESHRYELELDDDEKAEYDRIESSHHCHLTVMTWQLMYTASCPSKVGWLVDLVDKYPDDNFIIFSRYVNVRNGVFQSLRDLTDIVGVTDKFRTFQKAGGVLVTSYKAFGVGIDCSMAHHVVFLDLPWTAADFDQAVARAHRPGNKRCQVHTPIVLNTREERVEEIIEKKRGILW